MQDHARPGGCSGVKVGGHNIKSEDMLMPMCYTIAENKDLQSIVKAGRMG